MTKRFGFTLAEVLITLGIIGVVAAMTMPTLINQTNGAQYKAAYKKALSAISQAVTLNVALDDYNFADTVPGNSSTNYTVAKILNDRMNVVKSNQGADGIGYTVTDTETVTALGAATGTATNYTFYFNDGSVFSYKPQTAAVEGGTAGGCTEANKCEGIIDVNGQKGPNKVVRCDGETNYNTYKDNCEVKSPTDIYPVVFYDQTILPSTSAARAVLYGK